VKVETEVVAKSHHQWTDKDQDYVCFRVKCAECGVLLFEFVHQQDYSFSQDKIMAISAPNPSKGARSWYKPAVRVVCTPSRDGGDAFHGFIRVGVGEDRNQVMTSEPWTQAQFDAWSSTI